jgi:hypothetical protein
MERLMQKNRKGILFLYCNTLESSMRVAIVKYLSPLWSWWARNADIDFLQLLKTRMDPEWLHFGGIS